MDGILGTSDLLRELQQQKSGIATDRGKNVLTILYLCVLALCFITPIIYYCRLQFEDRNAERQLRELEAAGISAALQESTLFNREESKAARRKYNEERRARIIQLFAPVRMVLTRSNFVDNGQVQINSKINNHSNNIEEEQPNRVPAPMLALDQSESSAPSSREPSDFEFNQSATLEKNCRPQSGEEVDLENPYGEDDDSTLIELPAPGLHLGSEEIPKRLVSGLCTICLCPYTIGSDVVWSSNPSCEHAFHEKCIEKWLMKQRDGPLCPCCRRDFIVDPFDVEDETTNNALNMLESPGTIASRQVNA